LQRNVKNLFLVKYRIGAARLEAGEYEAARAQFEAFLDYRGRPTALAANSDYLVVSLLKAYAYRYANDRTADRLEDLAGFSAFALRTGGLVAPDVAPFWSALQSFFAAHAASDVEGRQQALADAERAPPHGPKGVASWTPLFSEMMKNEMRRLHLEATAGL